MIEIKQLFLFAGILFGGLLFGCEKKTLRKIKVAEVTHSVFYAPQYIAINEGIFAKYNLEVDLTLTPGADKVMASLLSEDVHIGLMGPEASVYVYNQGKKDFAINFLQLTQKDGSFLVGKEKEENFDFSLLKNKEIIAGRRGGMPFMTLEYVLNTLGVKTKRDDPTADVNLRTDIQFAAMAGAFINGKSDYVALFEPTATILENNKQGYVVASIGEHAGNIAYTCYSATKSYLEKNEDLLLDFTKAINEAVQITYQSSDEEVAKMIQKSFNDISFNDLVKVVKRYRDIEAWAKSPILENSSMDKLIAIMKNAKEITVVPPYDEIVNRRIAEKSKK